MNDMLSAVKLAGDFVHGGNPIIVAQEWTNYKFTTEQAEMWWEAGVFDAYSATILRVNKYHLN